MPDRLSLLAERRSLALEEPFRIARALWRSAENVFVTLYYGEHSGIGEASPDAHWGEDPDSVVSTLEATDVGSLGGPFDLEGVTGLLAPGSARAALDIAAHDLASKLAGLPLHHFLGLQGGRIPDTSVTLPIDDLDAMVARAARLADHPILKMKVGFEGDVEAVEAIREVFTGTLRIDANEGWSPDEAVERLRALERSDIELCEQPIERDAHEALAKVTEATSIPIFADEDVTTSEDVAGLAGVVDGVNLKLRKTGGIREAIRAISVARSVGLRVMLGCDLHSGVATSAGAHLGSLVDHLDMDGCLLLAEDPFPGVSFDRGRVILPDVPGLGVRMP